MAELSSGDTPGSRLSSQPEAEGSLPHLCIGQPPCQSQHVHMLLELRKRRRGSPEVDPAPVSGQPAETHPAQSRPALAGSHPATGLPASRDALRTEAGRTDPV